MVFGYNQERPSRETYDAFMSEFVSGLEDLGIPGLQFFVYGSYTRDDFCAGRSDIDGFLVFQGGPVIDKQNLRSVSRTLNQALARNPVPTQFAVMDEASSKEGTFPPYTGNFRDYFRNKATLAFGDNHFFPWELRYQDVLIGDETTQLFNLRKARKNLLYAAQYASQVDPSTGLPDETFAKYTGKTLESVSRFVVQIITKVGQEHMHSRFAGTRCLEEAFPELDLYPLLDIRRHLNSEGLARYDQEILSPLKEGDVEPAWQLCERSVTFMEELMGAYMARFPNTRRRRLKRLGGLVGRELWRIARNA